ncbi:MAG: hypothetical protein ABIZ07_08445 [Dermatophilaceae bacterium]
MILFFGYATDPALRLAVDAAERLGESHLLLDQLDLHDCAVLLDDLNEPGGPSGQVRTPGGTVSLAALDAAYARPLSAVIEEDPADSARGAQIAADVITWLDTTHSLVVSRPGDMHSNSSKPYQAQLIGAAGFRVPESLITTDPDEVIAFTERVGAVIFKSISGIRSIVRRLDDGYESRLERIRVLPTQFQALVEGDDIRVHVVGDEVFATRIISDATDYRYARRDGVDADLTPTTLPADVHQRCLDLAASLSLPFVGIDLRETPDGEYVCFEANPMPGYSYFESNTGQPISEALVRLLAGATPPEPVAAAAARTESR